jgi:hypothetical protein
MRAWASSLFGSGTYSLHCNGVTASGVRLPGLTQRASPMRSTSRPQHPAAKTRQRPRHEPVTAPRGDLGRPPGKGNTKTQEPGRLRGKCPSEFPSGRAPPYNGRVTIPRYRRTSFRGLAVAPKSRPGSGERTAPGARPPGGVQGSATNNPVREGATLPGYRDRFRAGRIKAKSSIINGLSQKLPAEGITL